MVALAPLANGVAKVQVMGPVPTQAPEVVVAAPVKPAASVSVSWTAFAGDGPLLETVIVYTEFWPSCTALTLVLTPMSADVGLIDTAPRDQFELPLKVSDRGTLGAPVRLLPVARASGGSLLVPPAPVLARFHCETCGPGMVTV